MKNYIHQIRIEKSKLTYRKPNIPVRKEILEKELLKRGLKIKLTGALKGGVPMRFGLFPKSRCAVEKSEHVLFLDRVFESNCMNLSDENWPMRYYKEVLGAN